MWVQFSGAGLLALEHPATVRSQARPGATLRACVVLSHLLVLLSTRHDGFDEHSACFGAMTRGLTRVVPG